MRYSDWKMISTFGFILGGLLLAGALITYFYSVTYGMFGMSLTDYPYRVYAVPLFLFGVALLVMGFVTGQRGREELCVEKQKPITDIGYCPNCGTKRDVGAQYCTKCGKKFE